MNPEISLWRPPVETRLENMKNPYQGSRKKVLTICSANLLRSPTMAAIFCGEPYNYNARSAGIERNAWTTVEEAHLVWADEIVCADTNHQKAIELMLFKYELDRKMVCLYIPDNYETFEPELIALIKRRYPMEEKC